ncbi:Methyl-accepting chemotaxis receptor protein, double cache and HAMP domains-containing [Desulfonema limicola]|uniref:Methyl-accepting chemotaxis receptor protein, double cache and HAMP domains-containing n=1 Tax=Desulfonema limicola TaxID=45656 RepID=A0A975GFV3_9BACT|nr:methyl-accepting chemotaxis protein [Desulfonema limicola]QTA79574.1 Methyl-accepting chemotaxis receptor protein, double cache and HAMP domains-containing [Desulfonema limicola]
MFKLNSIKTKLILLVSIGIFIAITIPVTYTSISSRNIAIRVAKEKSLALAGSYANQIKTRFNTVMDISRTISQSLAVNVQNQSMPRLTRNQANSILKNILANNDFMFGIWTCWEPDAFDNNDSEYINTEGHDQTGRYLPYFTKDEKENIFLEPCTSYQEENENSQWYQVPKKIKKEIVIPPTIFTAQGSRVLMVSSSAPIIYNEKFYGVAGGDITIEWLQDFAVNAVDTYYKKVEISIFSHNGIIAAFSNKPEYLGKSLKEIYPDNYKDMLENIEKGITEAKMDKDFLTIHVPVSIGQTTTPWQLRIQIPRNQVTGEANLVTIRQISIGAVILIIAAILMSFFVKKLINPLISLVNTTEKITKGNLAQDIEIINNDEIGILAQQFNTMILKLKEVIGEIQAGASHIVSASFQLSSASSQIAEGASQQAAAIEEISASMEQMTANISQTADNARQTEHKSLKAVNDIGKSKQVVHETLNAMKQIAQEISIISEIAKKTDLIAINTAVEASRAGEHGKGFSTVAHEVRKLSEKTQKAASRIDKISQSSIKIAETSGALLEKIVPEIQITHQLVQEISAACIEQDSGSNQVNDSVYQLNMVVQQNAASSEQMAASAKELADQSERLSEIISFFKLKEEEADEELSQESQKLIEAFIEKLKKHESKEKKKRIMTNMVQTESQKPGSNINKDIKIEMMDKDKEAFEEF